LHQTSLEPTQASQLRNTRVQTNCSTHVQTNCSLTELLGLESALDGLAFTHHTHTHTHTHTKNAQSSNEVSARTAILDLFERYVTCAQEHQAQQGGYHSWASGARFVALTSSFCGKSKHLLLPFDEERKSDIDNGKQKHKAWIAFFKSMLRNYYRSCQDFYRYNAHSPQWKPALWGWGEDSDVWTSVATFVDQLKESSFWKDWYSKSVRWDPIGAGKQVDLGSGLIVSMKGVQASFLIDKCMKAMELHPKRISRIVEFGPGTTMVSRVMHIGGFNGLYVMLDLSVMVVAQEYWLRLAALPALLFSEGFKAPCIKRGILLATTTDQVHSLVECPADQRRSLVYATYSLSESPFELRDAFLNAVAGSTDFFIVFAAKAYATWNSSSHFPMDRWGGNVKYFYDAIKSAKLGGPKASVCAWYEKGHGNSHYVLAASTAVRITCKESAGCMQDTVFFCPDDPEVAKQSHALHL